MDIKAKPWSVRLLASGWTIVRLGQQTVAVVRRVLVRGKGIIGEIRVPLPAPIVISVILEVEPVIFLAATAEHWDMPRRIGIRRQHDGVLPQGVGPEMPIELAVAEMICLLDKYPK